MIFFTRINKHYIKGEDIMKGVLMTKMVQEQNLTNLTPEIDLSDMRIMTAEINRQ